MDYDYSKRGYLLPDGCKDLIDVVNLTGDLGLTEAYSGAVAEDDGLVVTFKFPGLMTGNIEIFVEGRKLRIRRDTLSGQASRESVMEVPHGYDLARAQATYLNGELRIVIPKCSV